MVGRDISVVSSVLSVRGRLQTHFDNIAMIICYPNNNAKIIVKIIIREIQYHAREHTPYTHTDTQA